MTNVFRLTSLVTHPMTIYDISITLQDGIPIWPGNPPFELVRVNKLEESASSNVSKLSLGVHTGTHVDAPIHFIQGGSGVDLLPLELLTGKATVHALDLPQGNITAAALEAASPKIRRGTERVLLKTRNSELWRSPHPFRSDFAGVTEDGAQWIANHNIKLIGVDYLSVGPKGAGKVTHEILLKASVIIVEGLNLREVSAGDYDFYCLPLKLKDCDGAPARAILVDR